MVTRLFPLWYRVHAQHVLTRGVSCSSRATERKAFVQRLPAISRRPRQHQRVETRSKMTSEEYIAHLNRRLDELDLSIKISEVGPEDAYFLKKAQEKLREAVQTKREIDELIQRYEQLKAEKAALVAALEMRLRLAELQKAFLDALPPSAPGDAAAGAANNGPADLTRADKKGPQQDIKHISPLTEEEFASAKKCARSRFTLAGLNELVVAFNAALDAKYALLELPKSRLTGSQRKMMSTYYQQETPETKGLRFITSSDLNTKGSAFESTRALMDFMAIMRQCNRLREIRCPQGIVRYVVV